MQKTIDRSIEDIAKSLLRAIDDKKITGQLGRDLEKLCAVAYQMDDSRPAPIPMIIHCPNCGKQHVDQPEPDICECGCSRDTHNNADTMCDGCPCANFVVAWNNPPHKSHTCRLDYGGCGHIFRIADVPTNGVAELKTRGKDDTWPEVK